MQKISIFADDLTSDISQQAYFTTIQSNERINILRDMNIKVVI